MSEGRIQQAAAMLRRQALAANMIVSADDRVGAPSAAKLLGVHRDTMRAWRREGRGPAYYRQPAGKALITYAISDLARLIEESRQA